MGAAPPFAFRRLTQEHAVAMTVALFQDDDAQQSAVQVDAKNCNVLARVLEKAGAEALLPNFIAAEFNDNDGASSVLCSNLGRGGGAVHTAASWFLTRLGCLYLFEKAVEYRCSCIRCSSAATRAAVALAGPEFTASHCVFGRGGVNLKFMDPRALPLRRVRGDIGEGRRFYCLYVHCVRSSAQNVAKRICSCSAMV